MLHGHVSDSQGLQNYEHLKPHQWILLYCNFEGK